MARHKRHNPERRAWKGRSYKAAGKRIADLKEPKKLDVRFTKQLPDDLKNA